MDIKKNSDYNLENYRVSFLGIGFIVSLLFVYFIIEWKTYDLVLTDLGDVDMDVAMEEVVVTKQEKLKPPPPPPAAPKQILIVDNDVELEVELDIQADDFNEDDIVDIDPIEDDVDIPLTLVENKPIFPGCEKYKSKDEQFACMNKKIFAMIRREFEYPEIAKEMGIQGKVMVKFIINKKGKIGKIEVVRGIDKNLDKEAIRIIQKMKQKITFTPARQGDKAVNVSYLLPITFRLQ